MIPSLLVVAFHTLDNCYLASLVSLSFRSSVHSTFLHHCFFLVITTAPPGLSPMAHMFFDVQCSRLGTGVFCQTFLIIYFITAYHCWLVSSSWFPSPANPFPKSTQCPVHPWMRHLPVVPPEWHSGLLPCSLWFATIIWTSQPLLQPASCHHLLVSLVTVPYPIISVFTSDINSTRTLESPTFPFGNDQLIPSLFSSVL